MSKKIAVIDGNSLMHRAYHAVMTPMNAPDGTPTNAVFGFLSMLYKFIEMAHPDGIICAFDAGKPQFRIDALEQYKAQRPHMDDELRVQFPVIESLLQALNIPVVKVEGWEGDDILGTIAARDEACGYDTLLVSGDKDINQLVTDKTHVVTTKKGITDVVIFDPAMVVEKYGIEPAQFPDYLGLMGDTSDNIPGVPGIGPKTASSLLQRFGTMEGIYDNLDQLKGKQLERLTENREMAFLSRQIATIVRDVDFELDLDAISFPDFDWATAEAAFKAIQFNAHWNRLVKLVGDGGAHAAASTTLQIPETATGDDARALVKTALEQNTNMGVAFADADADSLFPTHVLAVATPTGVALFEGDECGEVFANIVRTGSFAAIDCKAALHEAYPADTGVPALITDEEVLDARFFDDGLAAYVLNSSSGNYTLPALAETYLACTLPETEDAREHAALEAQASLQLIDILRKALDKDGTAKVYDTIDAPLVGVLTIMERTGAPINTERLSALGQSTQVQIDELEARIYELAGEQFNIDSPKQLSHILFEVQGLPHGKKTKSGYSTDARTLKKLAVDHELPAAVLHYREFAKIKSTYIDALPAMADKYQDRRLHTSFNERVTTTGRLSSSDPNLQNIPVRTEFGKQIRDCFGTLREGDVFLSADYSQIELRLLANLSKDERLIQAFNSGADFHSSTAARVFGVDIADVTPQMRSRAKAVNFGIVYGQQAFGLAQNLEIPVDEARQMIDRYFEAYPDVRTFLDKTIATAKEHGYAETIFGRRRHIPELASKNAVQRGFGERTAMNHPMQGSAADIIKIAMKRVQKALLERDLQTKMLLQVHDELDFSVPEGEIEEVSALVKDIMENVVNLEVPLLVDISHGATWAEAH